MNNERFVGIMVGILTVAATLLVIAWLDRAEGRVPFDCVDPTERERVREIVLRGIDDGLQKAMTHLFDVWQKDPETEQPKRAQVGTTNAINAHSRARRLALAWEPCITEKAK
jgi:hypothetical protein